MRLRVLFLFSHYKSQYLNVLSMFSAKFEIDIFFQSIYMIFIYLRKQLQILTISIYNYFLAIHHFYFHDQLYYNFIFIHEK